MDKHTSAHPYNEILLGDKKGTPTDTRVHACSSRASHGRKEAILIGQSHLCHLLEKPNQQDTERASGARGWGWGQHQGVRGGDETDHSGGYVDTDVLNLNNCKPQRSILLHVNL